ncbi:unnamed protein product [Psylliodes chrysocephalus]|uniref:Uncharacterized protein n=1 Tax=Psylliodes chrysocephalus TaxID=3402493 RepID=A0A9P0CX86_9CUCU|nr:unnamed protein product [Psylliodes chrysocephala]
MPLDISPMLSIKKPTQMRTRGRKSMNAALITSSPYKDNLSKEQERINSSKSTTTAINLVLKKSQKSVSWAKKTIEKGERKYEGGTGGEPFATFSTDGYEKKVLETINTVSLEGDMNIAESATDFIFHNDDNNKNEPVVIDRDEETRSTSNAMYENVENPSKIMK